MNDQQQCPDCDDALEYLGWADDENGQDRQWWFCTHCWSYYMDEEVASANRIRQLQEQWLAELCGQMPLPGMED